MSLDVYLTLKGAKRPPRSGRIFVREGGRRRELTRAEWDARQPEREPVTLNDEGPSDQVFSANITGNLIPMMREAGLYQRLYEPEAAGVRTAAELAPYLAAGLETLLAEPLRFQRHNPENGWGDYTALVEFVTEYLTACREWPAAEVSVWV